MKGKWGANAIDAHVSHKNGDRDIAAKLAPPSGGHCHHLGIVVPHLESTGQVLSASTVGGQAYFPAILSYKNHEDA